jgi:hypothetical protein
VSEEKPSPVADTVYVAAHVRRLPSGELVHVAAHRRRVTPKPRRVRIVQLFLPLRDDLTA